MEMKKVKAAIVGCGMISHKYINSIQSQFNVLDVVACTDLDEKRMNDMAQTYGLKAMTYDAILADPEIEIILNLTNPGAHYPITKQALEAGKHVYSEKMIAVELEQGKELVELAKKNNVRLGVAPDTFLGAAIQTARYVVDSGLIGKPLSFVISVSRNYGIFSEVLPHLRKRGGSLLFDMGGYYLTAMGSMFGPVREVAAFTATNEPNRINYRVDNDGKYFGQEYEMEVPNIYTATLKYENGILGTLHMNSDCIYTEARFLTVYGTDGILYMDDPNCFGGEVRVKKVRADEFVFPLTHGYKEESRGIGAAEMAWAIQRNRPHRASMEMAFNIFETAHAVETSAQTGKVVKLESTFEKPEPLPTGYISCGPLSPMAESALAK